MHTKEKRRRLQNLRILLYGLFLLGAILSLHVFFSPVHVLLPDKTELHCLSKTDCKPETRVLSTAGYNGYVNASTVLLPETHRISLQHQRLQLKNLPAHLQAAKLQAFDKETDKSEGNNQNNPGPEVSLNRKPITGDQRDRKKSNFGSTELQMPPREPGQCWSKSEQAFYYKAFQPFTRSENLIKRLQSYEALHQRCTEGVGNWTEQFMGNGPPHLADCKYLIHSCPAGVGNHLVSLVSVFIYCILTNRVLILPWSNVRNSLCSPFASSTWQLPWYMDSLIFSLQKTAPRLPEIISLHNSQHKSKSFPIVRNGTSVRAAFMWLSWDWTLDDVAFFCPDGQKAIERVPWIVYHTEQYSVPGYFQMPKFQPQLKAMFPDRIVFPHIARYLLHPKNEIWERITKLYSEYMGGASRRVGIQVRTFTSGDEYAHERILECAVNISGVLPKPSPPTQFNNSPDNQINFGFPSLVHSKKTKEIAVLVTSLQAHHSEYLKEVYSEFVSGDGSFISVHTGAHEGHEVHDAEKDRDALTEMWLLSFSDALLTSEYSTFGYFAVGLSGIRPYLMNNANVSFLPTYLENGRPVCTQLVSVEPCYHFPPYFTKCALKNPRYIRTCLDSKFGKQLLPKSNVFL